MITTDYRLQYMENKFTPRGHTPVLRDIARKIYERCGHL